MKKTIQGAVLSALVSTCLLSTINASGQNTFPSSGNTGIGLLNPAASLDIYSRYLPAYSIPGTTYDANNTNSLNIVNEDAPQLSSPPVGVVYVPGNTSDIISVWKKSHNGSYANKRLMVLTADGKLRIGEKAAVGSYANYKLSVDGDIIAKRLVIQVANWADYVFDPNYALPSLSDVESFVAQNRHLPGVPSEAEVADKGIEMGEMNKVLLQKIEELTLYLIDLKKENEKMKTDYAGAVEELRTQIKSLQDARQ